MSDTFKIDFDALALPDGGDLVVCVGDDLQPGETAKELLGEAGDAIAKAAAAERFKGKYKSILTIPAPAGLAADRLIVVGLGGGKERKAFDWVTLGAAIAGKIVGREATLLADFPGLAADDDAIGDFVLGARLRAYRFDQYKTKKKKKGEDDEKQEKGGRLTIAIADAQQTKKAVKHRDGLAQGVIIARDLVNEPANVLGPVEFADRAKELEKLGVEVEILDEKQLGKIGMRALLGVAQGSERPARVAIMRWNGAKKGEQPLAFIGKGVVFDTGGISIKPARPAWRT